MWWIHKFKGRGILGSRGSFEAVSDTQSRVMITQMFGARGAGWGGAGWGGAGWGGAGQGGVG